MGTVARLLAEHVSFRCTSVDRIGDPRLRPGAPIRGRSGEVPAQPGLHHTLSGRAQPQPRAPGRRARRPRGRAPGCRWCASRPASPKRTSPAPTKTRRRRPVDHGLVLVGKAQERTSSWRGFVDASHAGHRPSHPHIAWRRQSSVPDHWYFYFADPEWGPAFFKICTYAPYPLWCCANGHEWAKCQLAKAGIGFEALDNGLRCVEDPAVAHRICARLGAGHLRGPARPA